MSFVMIIGAKSDIAKELARVYARNGFDLYLCARGVDELSSLKNDIKIRYEREVELLEFDISNFASHENFYNLLSPKPAGVVVAAGYMQEQSVTQNSIEDTLNTIAVNFTGAVSILNLCANDMEIKKKGFIVGISSVAGDRGRASNYIYGSAKAGFSAYLSGLRNRLFKSGVSVLTVKPGFVATKMTAHLELPAKLTATPQAVAEAIFKAQQASRDVLYTKSIWRFIMLIIKHIPESIFKKMSI